MSTLDILLHSAILMLACGALSTASGAYRLVADEKPEKRIEALLNFAIGLTLLWFGAALGYVRVGLVQLGWQ